MRVLISCVVAAVVAVASSGSVVVLAGAQAQTRAEQRREAGPELATLLDLVRLYVEQGRFEDAERTLRIAEAALTKLRAATQMTEPIAPEGTLRVGGGIAEPRKLRHVPPVYPEVAQAARVQGVVIAEVLVDETGAVADTRVLRSVPLLDAAATDAVRQWRFTPTLLNGKAVPVVMTVTVNFTLN